MQHFSIFMALGAALSLFVEPTTAQTQLRAAESKRVPARAAVAPDRDQSPLYVDLRTMQMNQSLPTAADFGPTLLMPQGEGPFGEAETNLLTRAEMALFMSSPDGVSRGGSTWIEEDESEGGLRWPGFVSSIGFGLNVIDAKRASLDSDAEDEMVLLSAIGNTLSVYSLDVDPVTETAVFQLLHVLGPVAATDAPLVGSIAVADFDGDQRDESGVFQTVGPLKGPGQTSKYWVLEDHDEGGDDARSESVAGRALGGGSA